MSATPTYPCRHRGRVPVSQCLSVSVCLQQYRSMRNNSRHSASTPTRRPPRLRLSSALCANMRVSCGCRSAFNLAFTARRCDWTASRSPHARLPYFPWDAIPCRRHMPSCSCWYASQQAARRLWLSFHPFIEAAHHHAALFMVYQLYQEQSALLQALLDEQLSLWRQSASTLKPSPPNRPQCMH